MADAGEEDFWPHPVLAEFPEDLGPYLGIGPAVFGDLTSCFAGLRNYIVDS